MVTSLYGEKIGMTRFFLEEGNSVPVTLVKAGPCVVIQKKTKEKDGYEAVQVGFEPQKESRVNKPVRGHFRAAGDQVFKYLKEIRVASADEFELGQKIGVDIFNIGDVVHVTARSKGRGFAGVIKRWGFSGGKDTHGSRSHRVPGSIGASATPGRVYKGRKLPGRMGNTQTTIKNLKVVDVRPELDIIVIKGCVPGARNSIVRISKA
ncbi:MAG: 50S ribosomal protein L3 [Deltaproteobacteria bacterium]|nr:50S ribosomal protein L3 [Deltaproteobacteria bacterium]